MRSDYTILVTEPYPATRAFMTDALTAEGYQVACCAEPAVTVEEIGAVRPDLVVLELRRDERDHTLHLIEQIRQSEATHMMPVLVTSTDLRLLRDVAAPLQQLDCVVLPKPFPLDLFLEYIAQALGPPAPAPRRRMPRASICLR
jgi:CheY-like chemotaxis protein